MQARTFTIFLKKNKTMRITETIGLNRRIFVIPYLDIKLWNQQK